MQDSPMANAEKVQCRTHLWKVQKKSNAGLTYGQCRKSPMQDSPMANAEKVQCRTHLWPMQKKSNAGLTYGRCLKVSVWSLQTKSVTHMENTTYELLQIQKICSEQKDFWKTRCRSHFEESHTLTSLILHSNNYADTTEEEQNLFLIIPKGSVHQQIRTNVKFIQSDSSWVHSKITR